MVPPPESAFSATEFKDRKVGLVIFGILTTLMGGLCILLALLMMFVSLRAPLSANAGAPQSAQGMIPGMILYSGMAAVLIWLGIGSMMERRWARALLLIVSWSWLVMGVLSVGMMAIMFPHLMEAMNSAAPAGQPEMPAAAKSLILVIPIIIIGVVFVILPIAWVIFYQSKHVKATCEAHDPVTRWTDRCPLPVIAVCLWLAFSAPTMLLMAVSFRGVIPFFGMFVVGPLGSAIYVLLGLLWGYSAWALYKLDRRGWWIVFGSMSLFCVSASITYSLHNVRELYVLMGTPEAQIAQIQKFGFFEGQTAAWMTLIGAAPFLGYLLYVRKFFSGRPE
jgi:hypothetical protein